MKSFAFLLTLLTFAAPATALAQDEVPSCSAGYALVISAGGPLCVNPTYLDGTWQDDPATCEHGYYQGSCAPAPAEPVMFEAEAYLYQSETPTPVQIAEVEAKRVVWLSTVELHLADQGDAR